MGMGAVPAQAQPQQEVIQGEYLQLISVVDPEEMVNMMPGDEVRWEVTVSAQAPEPGVIELGLSAAGNLALEVKIENCEVAWQQGVCPTDSAMLHSTQLVDLTGTQEALMAVDAVSQAQLLITVEMPEGFTYQADASTEVKLHAHGFGEKIDAGLLSPAKPLPNTGLALGGATLMAIGAAALGITGARLRQTAKRGSSHEQ